MVCCYLVVVRMSTGRVLREVSLSEPIRYGAGDHVEKWLHDLLCLDAASVGRITSGCPPPNQCELYPLNILCMHMIYIIYNLT